MAFSLLLALALTIVLVRLLMPIAPTIGLVDAPCIRKRHDGAIPLIGGLTIYLALAVTTLLFAHWSARSGSGLVMLGLPILLIGVLDDRNGLSPRARFAVEIVCCLAAAEYFGVRLLSLGELLPGIQFQLGALALPLTVVGLVGVMNAFNMTDGVDGLAGGLAFLIFSALAVLALKAESLVALQLSTVSAAVLGFLWFNSRFFGRSRAAIFMGDAGTLFIGFAMGWYLVLLSQGEKSIITPVSALWLFAVPLLDTVSVMIRRIRRGQSPFHADREHLHHIFLLAGFGVNGTVLVILGFQAIYIAIAFLLLHFRISDWIGFWLFIALFVLYYRVMSRAWKVMKRIKHFREWAGFEDRRGEDQQISLGRRSGADRRRAQLPFEGMDRRQYADRRQGERRASKTG